MAVVPKKMEEVPVEWKKIRNYSLAGLIVGILMAGLEYAIRIKFNTDPQAFFPLILRGAAVGTFTMGSVMLFEVTQKKRFYQKPFLYPVLIRSLFYTLIITFWLSLVNGIWYMVNAGIPFWEELKIYYFDDIYLVNVSTIFIAVMVAVGLSEINSLHRKGELLNFVLGKYHKPREVERIFCFIDLNHSTTIAEKLGHLQFASFLKDYYADITQAIRNTQAHIYQYVGYEIILSWPYDNGLKNSNLVHCFFQMKSRIEELKPK